MLNREKVMKYFQLKRFNIKEIIATFSIWVMLLPNHLNLNSSQMYFTKAFIFLFFISKITMAVVGKYIIVTIVKSENEIYFFKSKVKSKVKLSVNITKDYVTIQVYLFVHLREICNLYRSYPLNQNFSNSQRPYFTWPSVNQVRGNLLNWSSFLWTPSE